MSGVGKLKGAVLIGIALVCSGCIMAYEYDGRIPTLVATGDVKVYQSVKGSETQMCTIEAGAAAAAFLESVSQRYPDEWRTAPMVSYAPRYRVDAGATQMLFLKDGIVLSVEANGRRKAVIRDAMQGESLEFLKQECER